MVGLQLTQSTATTRLIYARYTLYTIPVFTGRAFEETGRQRSAVSTHATLYSHQFSRSLLARL